MTGIFVAIALHAIAARQVGSEDCVVVDGRNSCVVVPSKRRERRVPLVIYLHGNGSTGREDFFGLQSRAEGDGFLYSFPDGAVDDHGRRSWNATDACCARSGPGDDDVAFLNHLVDKLESIYPVDERSVFVVGHSLGGFMAQRFACDSAGKIAAVVSHAGASWKDASRCRPSEPLSVLLIHGDADHVVDYNGGLATRTGNPYPSAQMTFRMWAALDGCKGPLTALPRIHLAAASDGSETARDRIEGCKSGVGVELWTMRGVGHAPKLDPTAAQAVYQFLLEHPKK